MRRLPPFSAIEAFVQVARLGSVKAAAAELALSSPALSRRVQTLERFIGHALFERKHQSMKLNGEGEKLLTRIAPVLDMLTDAIEATTGEGDVLRLRLGTPGLFASQRIMPHLPDLRARHPNLHLDISTSNVNLSRLGEGMDAVIVLQRDVDASYYSKLVERGKISLIGSKKLIENGPFDPKDIAQQTILLHDQLMDTFEAWRVAAGLPEIEPLAVDHFDSGQLMLDAAAQGMGVAFLSDGRLADSDDPNLVSLSDVVVDSPYSYWFACRRNALSNRAVRLFHDWLFKTLPRA